MAKILSFNIEVYAITLFPFIISREEMSEATETHETIHFCQQKELFVLFFYILYLYDFAKGLIRYKDSQKAYYQIRFEQEAYAHHHSKEYLESRPKHNWRNYEV
jgi:hypothetical protein